MIGGHLSRGHRRHGTRAGSAAGVLAESGHRLAGLGGWGQQALRAQLPCRRRSPLPDPLPCFLLVCSPPRLRLVFPDCHRSGGRPLRRCGGPRWMPWPLTSWGWIPGSPTSSRATGWAGGGAAAAATGGLLQRQAARRWLAGWVGSVGWLACWCAGHAWPAAAGGWGAAAWWQPCILLWQAMP